MKGHAVKTPVATGKAETSAKRRVKVLLPMPTGNGYDYEVPAGMDLLPGQFVTVPLGPRRITGVVWHRPADCSVPDEKLKAVLGVFDVPPLAGAQMRFADWTAAYYMVPLGAVLRLILRGEQGLAEVRGKTGYRLEGALPGALKLTEKRRAVLSAAGVKARTAPDLAEEAGVTEGVVRGLAKAGALIAVPFDPDPPFQPPQADLPGKALDESQRDAAAHLTASVRAGGGTCLLDGVTGSGKTEVYMEAIAETLRLHKDGQVLVLLPEIALTLPFLQRLEERFGAAPAHWHSDVSSAGRRRVWKRVLDGSARLVVGARSALFLPWQNLKLIIVDEEHDSAYKQQDGILYNARDLAVAMGRQQHFPVVLASATPSLESHNNAVSGRYSRANLKSRFGPADLPSVDIIDLKTSAPEPGRWLSEPAASAVTQTLAAGQQVLLYLNRRGYAPVTLCRRCGERMTAPESDTWLVEHRYTGQLVCHQTGFSMPKPKVCPHCGAEDSLTACGPGVERIAEEARDRWPDARTEVFSSDSMERPGRTKELLTQMASGAINILVATQAAAKGHHFPGLTLVVGVDADLGLSGGDLRAAERTFQVLHQVSGRAGRAEKKGRVLLQTYNPEHRVNGALASGDRDAFLAAELIGREEIGMPPFGRLASLILSSKDEPKLLAEARRLAQHVPHAEGLEVWGPAPAPFYRLRGVYRQRFLIKADRGRNLQAFTADWLGAAKPVSAVRRTVDVDPYNFM